MFRLGIGLALAKYYSDSISDNVRRRFEQLLHDGYWVHKAPIGYKNVNNGTEDKPDRTIVHDPIRAHYVVQGFEMRALGIPYDVITKQLYEDGLRGFKNNKVAKSTIEKVLRNKFYFGIMTHGGKEYPHRYEPLISRALFDKAMGVKEIRSHNKSKYNSSEYALKQIPTCGRCGRAISTYTTKGKVYLRCSASGTQSCGNPNASESPFLEQIAADLAKVRIPEPFISKVIVQLKEKHENQQLYYADNITSNRHEYDGLQRKIDTLYDDRLDGRISADRYDAMATKLERRQQELNDQVKALTSDNKSFLVTTSYLLDLVQRAVELFDSSKPGLQQELLKYMLSNCKMNDKTLIYELDDPFKEIADTIRKALASPNSEIWQGHVESNHDLGFWRPLY